METLEVALEKVGPASFRPTADWSSVRSRKPPEGVREVVELGAERMGAASIGAARSSSQ